MKDRAVVLIGSLWDFTPSFKITDLAYDTKYVSFYAPWLSGNIDKKKVTVVSKKTPNKIGFLPHFIKRIYTSYKIIQQHKAKIVISHHDDANMSSLITLFFLRMFSRRKIKFFAFMRAGAIQYKHNSLAMIITKVFIKLFYSKFTKIFSPSKGNTIELKKLFHLKNIHPLYNPVDLKLALQKSKEKVSESYLKQIQGKKVFFTLGRLTAQKAQWNLIRSFSQVHKNNKNTVLVIIGTGELEHDFKKLVQRLKLKDSVVFLGSQRNIYPFLKYADVVVLSSLWESFGNLLVEALAIGKTIISFDCHWGPREILAPELDITSTIKYPYKSNGYLLSPPVLKYNFSNDELNQEEEELAKLMGKTLQKKYQIPSATTKTRASFFEIKNQLKTYKEHFI